MRQLGRPIIWVRQEFEPDLCDAFPEMKAKGIRITIKGTVGCDCFGPRNRSIRPCRDQEAIQRFFRYRARPDA